MALILKLVESFKESIRIHKEVECNYFILEIDGDKLLQIDTYGSDERQIPGKVSQSIQFSPEAIIELKELLNSKF